jgi:hypothetical protein
MDKNEKSNIVHSVEVLVLIQQQISDWLMTIHLIQHRKILQMSNDINDDALNRRRRMLKQIRIKHSIYNVAYSMIKVILFSF